MTQLFLIRKTNASTNTIGELSFKNFIQVWRTLEDVDRDYNQDGDLNEAGETKVWGQTAVPCGTYRVKFQHSPKFDRMMPYLVDVNTHSGVMFHWGTTEGDTNGCILIGKELAYEQDKYRLVYSRKAYAEFLSILAAQLGYKVDWQDKDKLLYTIEKVDKKADDEAYLTVTNEGRKKMVV